MSSSITQLKITLSKNIWLKKRKVAASFCCELFLPLFITAYGVMYWWIIRNVPIRPGLNPNEIFQTNNSYGYLACIKNNLFCGIGVTPATDSPSFPYVNEWISDIEKQLNNDSTTIIGIPWFLKRYANESALENANKAGDIAAGIVFKSFDENEGLIDYEIRAGNIFLPAPRKPRPTDLFFGPIIRLVDPGTLSWHQAGFTDLQEKVESTLMKWVYHKATNTSSNSTVPLSVKKKVLEFSNPVFFLAFGASNAASFIQLAFLGPCLMNCLDIVKERVQKLKEYLKIMGLKEHIYWLSWVITLFVGMMITAGGVYGICAATGMFSTNYGLPLATIIGYALCVITFALFVSTFAGSTQMGGVVVVIWMYFTPSFTNYVVNSPQWLKTLISLISPIAIQLTLTEQMKNELLAGGAAPQDCLPLGTFNMEIGIAMLYFDAVLYLILGWYLGNVLPSETGVPKPFYFMFTRNYWCPSKNKSAGNLKLSEMTEEINKDKFESIEGDSEQVTIKIRDLTKAFSGGTKGEPQNLAVNRLNLDIQKNKIFALLGQNGAGKSTTISMLTGLLAPSAGDAIIDGFSITTNMDEARNNLSICPQHDMLLEELSARQHLLLFGLLKGVPKEKMEERIMSSLEEVELVEKQNDPVSSYSGGMKRRLSLAISLVADSNVIFLDEPSSGLDPVSRRRIWDMLKNKKEGKTIILTTHFMEEADILGDRIAIMAKGKLKCVGTSEFLKKRFGTGFYLNVVRKDKANTKKILKFVQETIPTTTMVGVNGPDVTLMLPFDTMEKFPELFKNIEENIESKKGNKGILSYGVSMTTLEDVFLSISKSADQEWEEMERKKARERDQKRRKAAGDDDTDGKELEETAVEISKLNDILPDPNKHKPAPMLQQIRALMKARSIIHARSWQASICLFLLPAILTILAFLITELTMGSVSSGPDILNNIDHPGFDVLPLNLTTSGPFTLPYTYDPDGPTDYNQTDPANALFAYVSQAYNSSHFVAQKEASIYSLRHYLIFGARNDEPRGDFAAVSFKEANLTSNSYDVVIMVNKSATYSLPVVTNMLNNIILDNLIKNTSMNSTAPFKIFLSSHPLPKNETGTNALGALSVSMASFDQQFLVSLIFAYAIVGAAVAKDIVFEREKKLKLQLHLLGAKSFVYWTSAFLLDFWKIFLPFIGVWIVCAAWNVTYLLNTYFAAFFILSFFFSIAFVLLMYNFSKLFEEAETSLKWLLVLVLVVTMIPYIVIMGITLGDAISGTITLATDPTKFAGTLDEKKDASWYATNYITLIMPTASYTAGVHALMDVSQKTLVGTPTIDKLFEWDNCGKRLLAIIVHIFILIGLLVRSEMNENKIVKTLFRPNRFQQKKLDEMAGPEEEEDKDVIAERERLIGGGDKKSGKKKKKSSEADAKEMIRVMDVGKYYGLNRAVKSIHLGIQEGECFGLLGPNGAGKSTLIGMMIGEVPASSGDIHLNENSMYQTVRTRLYRNVLLACCFQADTLFPTLTASEHLELYLNLRNDLTNESEAKVQAMISTCLDKMNLTYHKNKESQNLSGGNKRKLCSALATLTGNKIVLLDEPSTGMDPGMRRALWDVLKDARVSRGLCIILTTHSMEEAEAVCSRIAIMVKGQLQCIGSSQYLKNRFGEGYHLHLSAKTEKNLDKIDKFIKDTFPASKIIEEYGRYKYYDLGKIDSLAKAFSQMEQKKKKLKISDYSISQTSLEDVFLSFAAKQNEDGEDDKKK